MQIMKVAVAVWVKAVLRAGNRVQQIALIRIDPYKWRPRSAPRKHELCRIAAKIAVKETHQLRASREEPQVRCGISRKGKGARGARARDCGSLLRLL